MANPHITIYSEDASLANVLRVYEHNGDVYLEIEGKHDGHKVCSTVRVGRARFAALLKLSGLLASVMLWACGDNRAPPDAPRPSCESLGCPSALCNAKGECVCNGKACHLG